MANMQGYLIVNLFSTSYEEITAMVDYVDVAAFLGYQTILILNILALIRHFFSVSDGSTTPLWAIGINILVLGFLIYKSNILLLKLIGGLIGWNLQRKAKYSRQIIFSRLDADEQTQQSKGDPLEAADDEWERVENRSSEKMRDITACLSAS